MAAGATGASAMISVVVVEDHPNLLEDIVFGLNAEGLNARGALDAVTCVRLCAESMPEMLVLDIMLPGEDGLALARRLRAQTHVGLVMLTALGSIENRLAGLDLADAYLVKPIDLRELAAVIRSVHRRVHQASADEAAPSWRLVMRQQGIVSPLGSSVELTYKECLTLALLARAGDRPVQTRALVAALEEDWFGYEKNRLELLISRLRQKIMMSGKLTANPIKAVRNEGYVLTIPLQVVD